MFFGASRDRRVCQLLVGISEADQLNLGTTGGSNYDELS
jgi:hypothetical protein